MPGKDLRYLNISFCSLAISQVSTSQFECSQPRIASTNVDFVAMDPLSISGSIIAVLQLTATVLQYLNGVGNAPSERQRLYSELSGVRDMLYILHSKATQMQEDDSFSPTLRSYCVAGGTLEQYKAALERLAKILKPSRGISKVTAVITWPSKSKEVKYLFDAIERQKTLLSLVQENDHL